MSDKKRGERKRIKRKNAKEKAKIDAAKKTVKKERRREKNRTTLLHTSQGSRRTFAERKSANELAVLRTLVPGDVRVSSSLLSPSNDVTESTMNTAMPIVVPLNEQALLSWAYYVVSIALSRGWYQNCVNPSYPLCAAGYLANALQAAALGLGPLVSTVPRWFNIIAQAISPVESEYGGRKYRYSWTGVTLPGAIVPNQLIPYGPAAGNTNIYLGDVDGSNIVNDLYAISGQGASYNESLGAEALTNMYQFLCDNATGDMAGNHVMEPYGKPNRFTNDTSVFSGMTVDPGSGLGGTGGFGVRLGLETPIKTPIFGHFTSALASFSQSGRAPLCNQFTGGDIGLIAGTINLFPENFIRKIRQPIYKFIDVMHLYGWLASFITRAIQLYVNEPTNELTQAVASEYWAEVSPDFLPNMTLQDFTIMVRGELMRIFANTQPIVQGVYPKTMPNSTGGLTPLASGIGTSPTSGLTPLTVPLFWSEMVKSMVARFVETKRVGSDGKMWNELILHLPVLCQNYGATLNDNDYQIKVNTSNGIVSYPVFTPATTPNGGAKNKKGAPIPSSPVIPVRTDKIKDVEQVFISTLDGSTTVSGNNVIAIINDPAPLNRLVKSWNASVVNLSSHIQRLTTVGKDGGPNGLALLGKTTYLYVLSNEEKTKGPSRVGKQKKALRGAFSQQAVLFKSSSAPLLSTVESIPFVTPVTYVSDVESSMSPDAMHVASLVGETYIDTVNYTNQATYMDEIIQAGVNLAVNAIDAGDNIVTRALVQASDKGQGDIFSSVLDTFTNVGSALLGSAARGAAQGLGMGLMGV